MAKVFVSGLVNIESSLQIGEFPINYSPIEYPFNQITSCVSGVAYNVYKALSTLGDEVDVSSFIGDDIEGKMILDVFKKDNLSSKYLIKSLNRTPVSIILSDKNGKRKIYCDLKNIQELSYPVDKVKLHQYDLLVLTNINFNRELVKHAKEKGLLIASDVHVISDINDEYNALFMENADILFLSNENIINHEADFIKSLYQKYHNKIIVVGGGSQGALCYEGESDKYYYASAIAPFGIISTVGAGDALFSAFIHFYLKGYNIDYCLKLATLFAGYKISVAGGSQGFTDETTLEECYKKFY